RTPGMPPAFGTGPVTGPPVSTETFAAAEKLVQVVMKPEDRAQAAASWQRTMAPVYERRTGPRKVHLDPAVVPASQWNPVLPGARTGPERDRFERAPGAARPLPANDRDIAYASV